jgi:hypothetical protein
MAKAAELNIDIVATADKAMEAFDKVKEKSSSSFSGMKIAALGAATAVLGGLGEATKAAAEHQVSVAKLEQAYKNAGVSTKDMGGALDEIEASSRKTGQSTEDNIAAYTKLVAATHSSTKAHQDLATAEDLAAFKGISVSDAATAITSAQAGNTRALKEMGIATKDASGKQLSATAIIDKLSVAVKGQADAFGQTATGSMARYHESLDQTKEKIGEALLPALQKVINALQPLFDWLSKNSALLSKLAPILAIAAGAIYAVVLAMKAWRVIQAIMNVLMADNPIGLVILAIAALTVVVILVIKHWRDFQGIINDVWGAIKTFAAWVAGHWKLIVDILLGPIGILLTNLGTVKQIIADIVSALEGIGSAVSKALGWLGKLPKSAGSILGKLNPFSLAAPAGPATTTMIFQITATPGADLPETVYQALRDYQRRHVRPELRPIFGG